MGVGWGQGEGLIMQRPHHKDSQPTLVRDMDLGTTEVECGNQSPGSGPEWLGEFRE